MKGVIYGLFARVIYKYVPTLTLFCKRCFVYARPITPSAPVTNAIFSSQANMLIVSFDQNDADYLYSILMLLFYGQAIRVLITSLLSVYDNFAYTNIFLLSRVYQLLLH